MAKAREQGPLERVTSAMDKDYFRRALEKKQDAMVRSMFAGGLTTSADATPQEPLTVDKLQRLTLDMRREYGPTPVFLSSKLFPADKVFTVEGSTEKFTCAHPGLWWRVERELRRDKAPTATASMIGNPLFDVQVIDIDFTEEMSEDQWCYLRGIWGRLIDAIKTAQVRLPEWLRPLPEFTKFS